jgi:purine-cytosine permease-like protein
MSSSPTGTTVEEEAAGLLETRGIEAVPLTERWGGPKDLFWMWVGALLNVQMVAFGALMIVVGLNLVQSVIALVIAGASWFVAGLLSLSGPATGTPSLTTARAPFGPVGARITAVFNWMAMVIFEIVTIVLAVFAGIAILDQLGITGTWVELTVVIVIGIIQFCLPVLGHNAILKTLKFLVIPFIVMFAVMIGLTVPKLDQVTNGAPASLPVFILGLGVAFSISGFGFMSIMADYSRYLPPDTPRKKHVVWVALGAILGSVPLMCFGAVLTTFVDASDPITALPKIFPSWFVVPYLAVAIVQILCLTSVDIYSSGLSLLAAGVRIKRAYAAAIDTAICGVVAAICVFYSVFYEIVITLLLFNMVWLAPWGGIMLVDLFVRRGRYDVPSLFLVRKSRYWALGGVRPSAMIAMAVGVVISLLSINTTVYVGPLANVLGGADTSIVASFVAAALVYLVLARQTIRREADDLGNAWAASPAAKAAASAPAGAALVPDESLVDVE